MVPHADACISDLSYRVNVSIPELFLNIRLRRWIFLCLPLFASYNGTGSNKHSGLTCVSRRERIMSPAKKKLPIWIIIGLCFYVLRAHAYLPPIIDGTDITRDFGQPAWVQDLGTDFGNNTDPTRDVANGSELDAVYTVVQDGVLYIGLTGNLETNFNKVEFFFDVKPVGQNRLRGDNVNVDYDGLNRMGDDGSSNGLTFDTGFEADYYLTYTNGDPGDLIPEHYASAATLTTNGPGLGVFSVAGTRIPLAS